MEPRDFTDMCTSTCESSLSEYIENVRKACNGPGDAAVKCKGYFEFNGTENVPIETVGLMFQYMFVRGCARDKHGENCYIQQSAYLPPDFDCDWTCALAYYWAGHFYPYSDWTFGDPELKDFYKNVNDVVIGSNYMMQGALGNSTAEIEEGWKTVKKCGLEGTKKSSPFDTGISRGKGDGKNEKGTSGSVVSSSSASGTATRVASTSTAPTVTGDGAAAATPTETGSAGRIELGMGYSLAGAVVLSWYMSYRCRC